MTLRKDVAVGWEALDQWGDDARHARGFGRGLQQVGRQQQDQKDACDVQADGKDSRDTGAAARRGVCPLGQKV